MKDGRDSNKTGTTERLFYSMWSMVSLSSSTVFWLFLGWFCHYPGWKWFKWQHEVESVTSQRETTLQQQQLLQLLQLVRAGESGKTCLFEVIFEKVDICDDCFSLFSVSHYTENIVVMCADISLCKTSLIQPPRLSLSLFNKLSIAFCFSAFRTMVPFLCCHFPMECS